MARLNYHHLYYFWHVARADSLTRAAEQLHVSQSALSSQIRQLEERMGVALFERYGRKLQLTAEGQRALEYANDIFRRGEELEALLRHGIAPSVSHVHIGVLSGMSRNFIESFVAPLLGKPGVRFTLHARGWQNLLRGLGQYQFDLVLANAGISRGEGDPLWQSQLLARQPLVVVGPAQDRPSLPFPQGYLGRQWSLPGQSSEIRSTFETYCARHDYQPEVIMETDDMAMLRLLARDGGVLSVLPEVVVRDEISQGLLCRYMTIPNAWENFYAITRKGHPLPEALSALLREWSEVQVEGTVLRG